MTKLEQKFEKRNLISKEDALEVLKGHYEELFLAYYEGLGFYNEEINKYPPEVRTRLDAPMLNSSIAAKFTQHFPDRWTVGKYGRVLFRWEGITMLIKKLNKHSKPSYIPTLLSEAIENQLQVPLFDDEEAKRDCVLFFGYTKDRHGELVNPRIVLYDDGVQWVADQAEAKAKPTPQAETGDVVVRLKQIGIKKAE